MTTSPVPGAVFDDRAFGDGPLPCSSLARAAPGGPALPGSEPVAAFPRADLRPLSRGGLAAGFDKRKVA